MAKNKRWTEAEESRLIDQVMTFPHNLSKCFVIVAEVTGRTQSAVAVHWYTKTCKDPRCKSMFAVSKEVPKLTLWQRIKNFFK